MAIMFPKDIEQYANNESEKYVFKELQQQLPDTYEVFYSVEWQHEVNGKREKSEADFIVVSPQYGFLCLEVKGGVGIRVENNIWYLESGRGFGERILPESPYTQAEKSMYYFEKVFRNKYYSEYSGIFGAVAVFPFYAINNPEELSNRDKACTIDSGKFSDLNEALKQAFKHWGGKRYGKRNYGKDQHKAFLEIIKKKVAIAAAAGALVKYKEKQFDVINRVQDNYIYFLSNVKQFYIRGGAGTGKTWIALKMAEQESKKAYAKVLYICASRHLALKAGEYFNQSIKAIDMKTLLSSLTNNLDIYEGPMYHGISKEIKEIREKYTAIFIDEAQDFSEEWAYIVKLLLKDEINSRLGVFYDDIQILRDESFGDAFMIQTPPYLLRENIRNTANIYNWATEKTSLGRDVITNPVEGPVPLKENMNDRRHLVHRLENLLKEYIDDEYLPNTSIVILIEDEKEFLDRYSDGIAKWKFVSEYTGKDNEIKVSSVEDFKGLESDVIIYIHSEITSNNLNYIAYTRAKFYLIELII